MIQICTTQAMEKKQMDVKEDKNIYLVSFQIFSSHWSTGTFPK